VTSNISEMPLLLRPIAERLVGLGYEIEYKYLRPVGRPGYMALVSRGRLVANRGDTTLRVVLFKPRLRAEENMHFYEWVRLGNQAGMKLRELREFESPEDFWTFAERPVE
jgi:hypothetical protein